MTFLRAFTAILAGAGLLLQSATAHSTERNPLSQITRIDDPVIKTPSGRIHYHSSFEISFVIPDRQQKIRFVLEPNHDILSEDATVRILGADGTVRRVEAIDRSEHKVYKGSAFVQTEGQTEWTNTGWARVNVYQDGSKPIFEGAFRVAGDQHHIQMSANYRSTAIPGDPSAEHTADEYMIVWRDSDIIPEANLHGDLKRSVGNAASCSSDELLYNRDETNLVYRSWETKQETSDWSATPRSLFGRQMDSTAGGTGAGVNLAGSIGSTAGCPTTRKVALVGIATDCTYTQQFNSTADVRKNIIAQVNKASALYENSFNISLGIQNLTISEAVCPGTPPASAPWNVPCRDDTDLTRRLNLFSTWRGQWKDNNAYWTLLTTCNTKSAVGLAWLGQVCQTGTQSNTNETIAGANVVVRTGSEWLVFAHETGHTFGAVHDCDRDTCADGFSVSKQQCCPLASNSCNSGGRFIMNPSTGDNIDTFSPCTIGNICSFLGRNSARVQCLASNRDVITITGSQCGNGIVEQGEDCDCGGEQSCANNPCCDAKTCKFTTGSVCDFSNEECCTQQCQMKGAGEICRSSTGICDPEEKCSGSSPQCPADITSPDGTGCGDSGAGLQCASGQCTSRNLQCKTLMGSLTTGNDTYSCSSQGCILSCASPEFGRNTCYTMQQYFLDGTPCEGGGKCSNGNCQGANLGNQIGAWFTDNKNIVIPVASAVGGLILLFIVCCCVSSFRRRRRPAAIRPPKPPSPGWGSGYGPMPMPAGGPQGFPVPAPYPAARQQQQPMQQNSPWEPMRSRSFRYA